MRVNCPSIYLGAVFRPTGHLPNKEGVPAPTQERLIQEGKTFTVIDVQEQGDGHMTRVTLSNGDQQITYGVETLLRGFSTVA